MSVCTDVLYKQHAYHQCFNVLLLSINTNRTNTVKKRFVKYLALSVKILRIKLIFTSYIKPNIHTSYIKPKAQDIQLQGIKAISVTTWGHHSHEATTETFTVEKVVTKPEEKMFQSD